MLTKHLTVTRVTKSPDLNIATCLVAAISGIIHSAGSREF